MDYLKNNIKIYVSSFKNKNILLVLILNLSFIIVTAALITLTKKISQPWIDKIQKVDLSNIVFQTEAQLQTIVSTLKGFILFAIFTAILFILLLITNWSLFQGIIYNILLKKRFNLKSFGKFLLLNIIWFIPWLILIFIILFGAKYFITPTLILMLLFLHFSFILYILFTKNNKIKIKQSLKIGTLKIHHFIIPYILIAITFIIISQLNLLKISYLTIAFIYLIFFSWLQNYTKEIVLNIQRFK